MCFNTQKSLEKSLQKVHFTSCTEKCFQFADLFKSYVKYSLLLTSEINRIIPDMVFSQKKHINNWTYYIWVMGDAPTRKEIADKKFWHLLTLCERVYEGHQNTETARKRRKEGKKKRKKKVSKAVAFRISFFLLFVVPCHERSLFVKVNFNTL